MVFETKHRVPSQGYAMIREKSKGLKEEYRHLSSRELGILRREGKQVGRMACRETCIFCLFVLFMDGSYYCP